MSPSQQLMFIELRDAGVYDQLFDATMERLVSEWERCEDAERREALWHRQRALRELRREFNKPKEIDAA